MVGFTISQPTLITDTSGTGSDARLADLLLAPGAYTVEATTATNEATGAYRVPVQGDFSARAPDQPGHVLATVCQPFSRTWAHLPAAASVRVQSVTPEGLDAAVIADDGWATLTATATHADDYTVAYTASGHTSTITTTVDADCPPRHVETDTRTCTPLATALPAGCTVTELGNGRAWGYRTQGGTFGLYGSQAPEACVSLSQSDRALYYSFSLTDRLPIRMELEAGNGGPAYLVAAGGSPSMTI